MRASLSAQDFSQDQIQEIIAEAIAAGEIAAAIIWLYDVPLV